MAGWGLLLCGVGRRSKRNEEIRKSIEQLDNILDEYDDNAYRASIISNGAPPTPDQAAKTIAAFFPHNKGPLPPPPPNGSPLKSSSLDELPPPHPDLLNGEEVQTRQRRAPPLIPRRNPETKLSVSSDSSSQDYQREEDLDAGLPPPDYDGAPESGYITPDQESSESEYPISSHTNQALFQASQPSNYAAHVSDGYSYHHAGSDIYRDRSISRSTDGFSGAPYNSLTRNGNVGYPQQHPHQHQHLQQRRSSQSSVAPSITGYGQGMDNIYDTHIGQYDTSSLHSDDNLYGAQIPAGNGYPPAEELYQRTLPTPMSHGVVLRNHPPQTLSTTYGTSRDSIYPPLNSVPPPPSMGVPPPPPMTAPTPNLPIVPPPPPMSPAPAPPAPCPPPPVTNSIPPPPAFRPTSPVASPDTDFPPPPPPLDFQQNTNGKFGPATLPKPKGGMSPSHAPTPPPPPPLSPTKPPPPPVLPKTGRSPSHSSPAPPTPPPVSTIPSRPGFPTSPPSGGMPPPPPPTSTIPRPPGQQDMAAAPPPPPPPPPGGANSLAAQLQNATLRSTAHEEKPSKPSPAQTQVHSALINQIQTGVSLKSSPLGNKIRGPDDDPRRLSSSSQGSYTSHGDENNYQTVGEDSVPSTPAKVPPPPAPKPQVNRGVSPERYSSQDDSDHGSNTMPSGGRTNTPTVNTNEFSIDPRTLPGYQEVPENCPAWKIAMIERKNKQLEEEARQKWMEEKAEEEKWKDVPEWKKALILEKEKKKQEELAPLETEKRKKQEELAKLNSMPEWKKNLLMKKKDFQ